MVFYYWIGSEAFFSMSLIPLWQPKIKTDNVESEGKNNKYLLLKRTEAQRSHRLARAHRLGLMKDDPGTAPIIRSMVMKMQNS